MLKLTPFYALLILCSTVFAQTWISKDSLPGTTGSGRLGAMCFSLNGKVYIGGGYKGNFINLKDFWEYDPTINEWTQLANIPGAPNRTAGIAFSGNGKGYIGLGSSDFNIITASFLNDLWQYDPAADSWTKMASLPDSGRHFSACFTVGDKAYVIGGSTDYPYIATNDVWEYDMTQNVWTAKAPFPASQISKAMAFAIGNYGYIVGGEKKMAGTRYDDSTTYEYNTSTNQWKQKADYCSARKSGVAFTLGNKGYAGLGINELSTHEIYYEEFCMYDAATNSWSPATSFPGIARAYAIATVADNKAYAGGGFLYLNGEIYKKDWAVFDAGVTGEVELNESSKLFTVYPNPASNELNIKGKIEGYLLLCDIYGRIVKRYKPLDPVFNKLDLSELSNGIYHLYLENSPQNSQTLIINH